MRSWLSALIFFVVGVVLGGAVGSFLIARHYNQMFRGWYLMGVVEQAQIAREVRMDRAEALAERIEGLLPRYALDVESQFDRSEDALPALWSIRDFYQTTGTSMPDEVRELLAELPPKPADCCTVEKPELR